MRICTKCNLPKEETEFSPSQRSWCISCNKQKCAEYYAKNRLKMNEKCRQYHRVNRDVLCKKAMQRYEAVCDTEEYREQNRTRAKKYYHANKLRCSVGAAMRRSLSGNKKGRHWESLVGYTVDQLKAHLEALFQPGMNWDNYGRWHVDHKRPVCSFNITTADGEEFKTCWDLMNLQPLWAKENLSKAGKM